MSSSAEAALPPFLSRTEYPAHSDFPQPYFPPPPQPKAADYKKYRGTQSMPSYYIGPGYCISPVN